MCSLTTGTEGFAYFFVKLLIETTSSQVSWLEKFACNLNHFQTGVYQGGLGGIQYITNVAQLNLPINTGKCQFPHRLFFAPFANIEKFHCPTSYSLGLIPPQSLVLHQIHASAMPPRLNQRRIGYLDHNRTVVHTLWFWISSSWKSLNGKVSCLL